MMSGMLKQLLPDLNVEQLASDAQKIVADFAEMREQLARLESFVQRIEMRQIDAITKSREIIAEIERGEEHGQNG